jgi:iron complex outermembrane receptor protein
MPMSLSSQRAWPARALSALRFGLVPVVIGSGSGYGATAHPASEPTQNTPLPDVVVTGSAWPRLADETAMPITTISAGAIRSSGATSLVDLLNASPFNQGATGESTAVGGATFGFAGVSLHNLGEQRTLVLLNGHRLASFGGQSVTGFAAGFDLNAIPLAAIDRIEMLRSGDSALYGSDAIAGVVNIITRRDAVAGELDVGITSRTGGGARERRASFTKGFGSFLSENDNLLISLHHDERTPLAASQRSQASTGRLAFTYEGKPYRLNNLLPHAMPANVYDVGNQLISPYLKLSSGHACPMGHFRHYAPYNDGSGYADDYCAFDNVSTLEIYPERTRDHFFGSYTGHIGLHDFFADLLLSRSGQRSRIAPLPGGMLIPAGSPLHDTYLLPLGFTDDTIAYYRLLGMKHRTNDDQALFHDLSLGLKGGPGRWAYQADLTHSRSRVTGRTAGQMGTLALARLGQTGVFDPFVPLNEQRPENREALAAASYTGEWDGGTSTLSTLSAKVTGTWLSLPAGPLMLAAGANWMREQVAYRPSLFAQGRLADPANRTLCQIGPDPLPCDMRVNASGKATPFTAGRNTIGFFGEMSIPLHRALKLDTALRHDHYTDVGSATVARSNFRWAPHSSLLIRGSLGSGFRAPSPAQLGGADQPYGSTSSYHACTPELQAMATSLNTQCRPGSARYAVVTSGNPRMRSERSLQSALGVRGMLARHLTLGADLWHVTVKDAIDQIPEEAAFNNPELYRSVWRAKEDFESGQRYLAFAALNDNMVRLQSTGLDVDLVAHGKTAVGMLSTQLDLTYMIQDAAQLRPGGPAYSSIGKFSERDLVTFRWKGRWRTTLKSEGWSATLVVNFKSGYRDKATVVDELDSEGKTIGSPSIQMKVPWFVTADVQTVWQLGQQTTLTLGALNLLNTPPPFVPSSGGLNRGQPSGYDDRYYDPRGRSVYADLSYLF